MERIGHIVDKTMETMAGVFCSNSALCTAVTYYYSNGDVPRVDTWDGISWSFDPRFVPNGYGSLYGIFCPSSAFCVAVGYSQSPDGTTYQTLIETLKWRSLVGDPGCSTAPLLAYTPTPTEDTRANNPIGGISAAVPRGSGDDPINTESGHFSHTFSDLLVSGPRHPPSASPIPITR